MVAGRDHDNHRITRSRRGFGKIELFLPGGREGFGRLAGVGQRWMKG